MSDLGFLYITKTKEQTNTSLPKISHSSIQCRVLADIRPELGVSQLKVFTVVNNSENKNILHGFPARYLSVNTNWGESKLNHLSPDWTTIRLQMV